MNFNGQELAIIQAALYGYRDFNNKEAKAAEKENNEAMTELFRTFEQRTKALIDRFEEFE